MCQNFTFLCFKLSEKKTVNERHGYVGPTLLYRQSLSILSLMQQNMRLILNDEEKESQKPPCKKM